MRKIWCVFFLTLSFGRLNAQDQTPLTHEVRLVVDNDVFTSLYRDQYYTSGLFGYYRKWIPVDKNFKLIRSFSLNQRMYTPRLVSWSDTLDFDRPYAGLLSAFIDHEFYLAQARYLKLSFELGWMGGATKTAEIHQFWHRVLQMPIPSGWDYQINNSPVMNFYGTYVQTIAAGEFADMATESNVAFGTIYSNVRQEILFRLGVISPLDRSVHYNGQLGNEGATFDSKQPTEFYVFAAPGLEFNQYNATIEGNLFGIESTHTEASSRWIFQQKFGVMVSWSVIDATLTYYVRSKETAEAFPHFYGGLHLNYRFK
ncbi:MAG: lipid A deacylase LpxR family protein [Cyclobacteriaceae bacterium]